MTIHLRKLTPCFAILLMALPFAANAGTITIGPIAGDDDGGTVGGFAMTDWEYETNTDPTDTTDDVMCLTSAGVTGQMCFQGNGTPSDIDIIDDPSWWEHAAHDNVFVTNQSWIEILLPANTVAISLWVGASFGGSAWIGAYDSDNDYLQTANFGVGPGNTPGYGISTDGCTYLTSIIVEPADWGFGNISISQDTDGSIARQCHQVPEPSPLALILTGILGLALARQLVAKKAKI